MHLLGLKDAVQQHVELWLITLTRQRTLHVSCVHLSQTAKKEKSTSRVVPQGPTLTPLLFLAIN